MVQVQRTFTVHKPTDVVANYLKDFARAEEWDPGTRTCRRVDDGPVAVGARWLNVSEFKGKETELTYQLARMEPGHLVFVGKNKTATSTDDLTLTAVPEGTSITYRATIVFHGLAKLADPFLKREFERLGDAVVDSMTTAVDRIPA
jgi:carbon monoxide dehydrogenase subunit G